MAIIAYPIIHTENTSATPVVIGANKTKITTGNLAKLVYISGNYYLTDITGKISDTPNSQAVSDMTQTFQYWG